MVEDQAVCVGAGAFWNLGWRFHHLHDQHLWCGSLPAHRLPGGQCKLFLMLLCVKSPKTRVYLTHMASDIDAV